MVDRRHRYRGAFSELFAAFLEGLAKAGIPVGLGFPNEHSLRALHRFIPLVAILERYHLALGSPRHAELRDRVGTAPERARLPFSFHANYALDARYGAVWRSCAEMESISIWKDGEYLAWKYGASPAPHRLFALEFADDVIALGVCRERGERVQLLELIACDKNIYAARELLLCIADHYHAQKFEELYFVGCDPWFFAEVFADFERRPSFSGHVHARATNRDEAFLYENPLNWTVVLGDSDS
jgi:hypothetical protein